MDLVSGPCFGVEVLCVSGLISLTVVDGHSSTGEMADEVSVSGMRGGKLKAK